MFTSARSCFRYQEQQNKEEKERTLLKRHVCCCQKERKYFTFPFTPFLRHQLLFADLNGHNLNRTICPLTIFSPSWGGGGGGFPPPFFKGFKEEIFSPPTWVIF